MRAYTMPVAVEAEGRPLAAADLGRRQTSTEFNAKWVRTLRVLMPEGVPQKVDQQITHIDPYFIYSCFSRRTLWRLTYRTSEWDPEAHSPKLLVTHPELAEPDGKCNPDKRLMLAKFMLDAGWLQTRQGRNGPPQPRVHRADGEADEDAVREDAEGD